MTTNERFRHLDRPANAQPHGPAAAAGDGLRRQVQNFGAVSEEIADQLRQINAPVEVDKIHNGPGQ